MALLATYVFILLGAGITFVLLVNYERRHDEIEAFEELGN